MGNRSDRFAVLVKVLSLNNLFWHRFFTIYLQLILQLNQLELQLSTITMNYNYNEAATFDNRTDVNSNFQSNVNLLNTWFRKRKIMFNTSKPLAYYLLNHAKLALQFFFMDLLVSRRIRYDTLAYK